MVGPVALGSWSGRQGRCGSSWEYAELAEGAHFTPRCSSGP